MSGNRTTVKANVISKNVPSVTNAVLTDMLNNDFADSIKFREDVAVSQTSSTTNITLDFSGKDRIDLTRTGGPLNISVSNLDDGDEKFILITKTSGQTVAFTGVTDITPVKENADALALVLYEITRKGSNYFVKAWVASPLNATTDVSGIVEKATPTERTSGATDKFIDAELLKVKTDEIDAKIDTGAWQTPSYNAGFSGDPSNPFQYRLAYGRLEIRGNILSTTTTSGTAFTLPLAYRPATQVFGRYTRVTSGQVIQYFTIFTNGNFQGTEWITSANGWSSFNHTIILD